jgi:dethiobiotin synthetase
VIRFVTGTDTGVGKTVVAALLAADAAARGRNVVYVKPVQTGLAPGVPGDADFVAKAAGVRAVEGVRYPLALAPAVAAAQAGESVDVDALVDLVAGEAADSDDVVVEGAGGLLVPLADGVDMAAFALSVGAHEVVVVTRPGLGTLNHTALTLEAARRRGLDPVLVVSNWPETPGLTETTNLALMADMAPILATVPFVEGVDVEGLGIPTGLRLEPRATT